MVESGPDSRGAIPQGETLRTLFKRQLTEAIRRRDAAYVLSGGTSPKEDAAVTIARGEIGALGRVLRRLRESYGVDDITLTGQVVVFARKGETVPSEQEIALRAQLAAERKKLAEQRISSDAKIAVLSARADISPEEVIGLRSELTALRARPDITSEVAGLQDEVIALRARADISPEELASLLEELRQAKRQVRERPDFVERAALEKKLAEALVARTTSEGQLRQARDDRRKMRLHLQSAEATRRSAQRRADTETTRRREEVKELKDALGAKDRALQEEQDANEALREKNVALEAEVTRLRAELSSPKEVDKPTI